MAALGPINFHTHDKGRATRSRPRGNTCANSNAQTLGFYLYFIAGFEPIGATVTNRPLRADDGEL